MCAFCTVFVMNCIKPSKSSKRAPKVPLLFGVVTLERERRGVDASVESRGRNDRGSIGLLAIQERQTLRALWFVAV